MLEDDYVVKMRSSILDIQGDWLKEWDEMKSLAKVVKLFMGFSIISFVHYY